MQISKFIKATKSEENIFKRSLVLTKKYLLNNKKFIATVKNQSTAKSTQSPGKDSR